MTSICIIEEDTWKICSINCNCCVAHTNKYTQRLLQQPNDIYIYSITISKGDEEKRKTFNTLFLRSFFFIYLSFSRCSVLFFLHIIPSHIHTIFVVCCCCSPLRWLFIILFPSYVQICTHNGKKCYYGNRTRNRYMYGKIYVVRFFLFFFYFTHRFPVITYRKQQSTKKKKEGNMWTGNARMYCHCLV